MYSPVFFKAIELGDIPELVRPNDYNGGKYYKDDNKKNDCFRTYDNAEGSYKYHSIFLTTRKQYSKLFDLKVTDYKGWAKGLKEDRKSVV